MLSVVIPVYDNHASLPELMEQLQAICLQCPQPVEAVFVVDGSPDLSYEWLQRHLPGQPFASQLLLLSRNFGSFVAIRAGLEAARGDITVNKSADLQEPYQLVLDLYEAVRSEGVEVALGTRRKRDDPWASRFSSSLYWRLYRAMVQKEMPVGGGGTFACSRMVRQHLLACRETNSSLLGLLLWLGFSRREVPYDRLKRRYGKSGWTVRRKWRYMANSVLAFSDLPVLALIGLGMVSLLAAFLLYLFPSPASGGALIAFFGGINALGLGIIGAYVWRCFENSKQRPLYIVACRYDYPGSGR